MQKSKSNLTIAILTHRLDDGLLRAVQSGMDLGLVLIGITTNSKLPGWLTVASKHWPVQIVKLNEVKSFAASRAAMLKHVKTEWTLFLDSDERISPQLSTEISNVLAWHSQLPTHNKVANGYYLHRIDWWQDGWVRHGEVGNTKLLRLFKTNLANINRDVHEVIAVPHPTDILSAPIWHYPNRNIAQFIEQISHYAQSEAKWRFADKQRWHWLQLLLPPTKFFYNYICLAGYKDGMRGLTYAIVMSLHSLLVRVYSYEIYNKHK